MERKIGTHTPQCRLYGNSSGHIFSACWYAAYRHPKPNGTKSSLRLRAEEETHLLLCPSLLRDSLHCQNPWKISGYRCPCIDLALVLGPDLTLFCAKLLSESSVVVLLESISRAASTSRDIPAEHASNAVARFGKCITVILELDKYCDRVFHLQRCC